MRACSGCGYRAPLGTPTCSACGQGEPVEGPGRAKLCDSCQAPPWECTCAQDADTRAQVAQVARLGPPPGQGMPQGPVADSGLPVAVQLLYDEDDVPF